MVDEKTKQRRLLLVSGLSGAGKSLVLNTLEDLDFYCIDNLPISLFQQLSEQLTDPNNNFPEHVGVGIDARSPESELSTLPRTLAMLRNQGVDTEVVFIEASKNTLTARFSETRRKHPLSTNKVSLSDAFDKERSVLGFLSDMADLHIDTSHTTAHDLRNLVRERIADRPSGSLSMQLISFGYKNGVPRDADFVFDVRCLPNPHWQEHLRTQSGKDQDVINYFKQQPTVGKMIKHIKDFFVQWVPEFEAENRCYLCIAIGCTGGRHRSVYLVDELSSHFFKLQKHIVVRHRDL